MPSGHTSKAGLSGVYRLPDSGASGTISPAVAALNGKACGLSRTGHFRLPEDTCITHSLFERMWKPAFIATQKNPGIPGEIKAGQISRSSPFAACQRHSQFVQSTACAITSEAGFSVRIPQPEPVEDYSHVERSSESLPQRIVIGVNNRGFGFIHDLPTLFENLLRHAHIFVGLADSPTASKDHVCTRSRRYSLR